jgi:hypothetical protein
MYKYNCSILVFLELHTDPGSTRAILENLNLLKNLGYLTYLLEEAEDMDFAETYSRMEANGNLLLNIVKKSSILPSMKGIPEEQISLILEIGNKDIAIGSIMEAVIDQYYSIKDSYAATLSLMSKVNKDADLSIHNIDMPSKQKERMEINSDEIISLRDAYFSQKINKLCLEGHTKQVFLVGAAHGPGVKKILEQEYGIQTKLLAVFSSRPSSEKDLEKELTDEERTDQLTSLRQKYDDPSYIVKYGHEDTKVIDLYVHNDFNTTQYIEVLATEVLAAEETYIV